MAVKKTKKTAVVLRTPIRKLGNVGDIVKVAPGYHRNFLEPQGKAFFATKDRIEEVRAHSETLKQKDEERRVLAVKYASCFENIVLSFTKESNEAGVMFGSVSSLDVCQGVIAHVNARFPEENFTLSKAHVLMDKPFKTFGQHTAIVELHPQVLVDVILTIAPKMLHG